MTDVRITKRVFDGLEPKAGEFTCWDGDIPGFGVRVRPSGAKSFVVMYRVGGRNSPLRKVTLGSGNKLTVEEARAEARKVLAKAELGEDTAEKLAKGREAKTMAEFCDLYLTDAERGNIIGKRGAAKKASTLSTDKGRIARHIKPLLGKKLVRDVKRSDIERFLRDVANGKTATDQKTKKHGRAIVTGGKGTATRTVRLLGGIFSYAMQLGILASLPRIHGCEFVIVGDKSDSPRSDPKRPWALVIRAAGLERTRIHDLRHTYASHGAAAGMGLTVVGRLLGHADVKTTNCYSHFDVDPLRRAANAIGNSLNAAMGEGRTDRSNIVLIRQK